MEISRRSELHANSMPTRSRQPQRRGHRIRWWAWLTGSVTVMVSIAALVVSVLAYQDQHASDVAAGLASQRQYADQVSFWIGLGDGRGLPSLVVQNRSVAPISGVGITLKLQTPSGDPDAAFVQQFSLGLIPPCTISSTTMTRSQVSQFEGGAPQASAAGFYSTTQMGFGSFMTFTDALGRTWQITGFGVLRSLGTSQAATYNSSALGQLPDELDMSSKLAPATGCS